MKTFEQIPFNFANLDSISSFVGKIFSKSYKCNSFDKIKNKKCAIVRL